MCLRDKSTGKRILKIYLHLCVHTISREYHSCDSMADTAGGPHMHDPTSEWSQFDFGHSDQPYAPLDTEFSSSTQTSQSYYQHNSYYDSSQETHGVLYDSHGQALLPPSYANEIDNVDNMDNVDNVDNMNGSRLTQVQMAALENSFVAVPKPKTDYKRSLAEKLGLELPRVNVSNSPTGTNPFSDSQATQHWFQNRRQKAKSQKHHGKQESDASSTGAPSVSIAQPLSLPVSETPISSASLYLEPSSFSAGPFPYNLSMDSTTEFSHPMLDQSGHTHLMDASFDLTSQADHSVTFRDGPTTGPAWMNDLTHSISVQQSFGTSTHEHRATSSLSPQSLTGSHTYATGFDSNGKEFVNPPYLQNNVIGSGLIDNHSSQTLESNASSMGETNNLMTPPTSTPPLPWLSSEFVARRASDSSELAHNVEGMHLQHGQPGLGLINTTMCSAPGSHVTSAVGLNTPDTSPEQVVGKYAAPPDLASRRKRHRPAALRPETNRSASCTGPSTLSPHTRNSSMSLIPPTNQVRRIQSQGQNLNTNFRVHKPTNPPAQISPRNLQTHFEKHSFPQVPNKAAPSSASQSPTTTHNSISKPSASAASANRSPAEYQHEFHVVRPANTWNHPNPTFHLPHHGNASVPDLHSGSSHLQHSLTIQVPSQPNTQHQPPHCPPQSAPPQQTTFFDDSPNSHHGPFHPPNWQGHTSPSTGAHNMSINHTPVHQPAQFTPQNGNGYLPPFAPQFQFPQESSPMSGYPGPNIFPNFPPGAISGSPITPVELDIRVELGPEPKLTCKPEKFEFSHTFSDTYGQHGEKK